MSTFPPPHGDGAPFPGVDPASAAVFRSFMRASHAHRQLMSRAMAAHDVHPAQMLCLGAVAHDDGVTQRDLARRLSIAAPTLSVMLQKMEKAGYIERRADENDQRLTRIYVTADGERVHEQIHGIMAEAITEMTGTLTPEEREELARLLGKLGDGMASTKSASENVTR